MLDSVKVGDVIAKINDDDKLIHAAVKKAGHEPTSTLVYLNHLDTHNDLGVVIIRMEWDSSKRSPCGMVGDTSLARYKWLDYITGRLNIYGKSAGLVFVTRPETLEFGASYRKDKGLTLWTTVCIYIGKE